MHSSDSLLYCTIIYLVVMLSLCLVVILSLCLVIMLSLCLVVMLFSCLFCQWSCSALWHLHAFVCIGASLLSFVSERCSFRLVLPGYVDDGHSLSSLCLRADWFKVLCGQWDDWCLPDNSKPGLSCCQGYTCKCNLWNTNCRCKSKLFSGK